MPAARHTDAEVAEAKKTHGLREAARRLGYTDPSSLAKRLRNIENRTGRQIRNKPDPRNTRIGIDPPGRINLELRDGVVLIFSDAHYWPDVITTMHRAFVEFCREFRPALVINNGDSFDGAGISRHPPIRWEQKPSVKDEIEANKERHHEIEKASPINSRKIWNLGNHDCRFETRLATMAPEYAQVHGFHLRDHFPAWECAWSTWINNEVVVKHRYKGGAHAVYNNIRDSGKHLITGHLHNPQIIGYVDYNDNTRWGMDLGTLAEPYGPQFEYLEDNPRNWRTTFGMLTFRDGRLMKPELIEKIDEGHVEFRGKIWGV